MNSYKIGQTYGSLREARDGDKPREKMLRLGAEALTDKELVMLIVGSGTKHKPVDEIASDVLEKIDSESLSTEALLKISGLGEAKSTAIWAALELGRRKVTKKPRRITNPRNIFDEVRHYSTRDKEHLIVLMLNGANEVIDSFVATIGLVNQALVHPREVFGPALQHRASAIVIAHNHPSGNLTPSDDDKITTSRLRKSGELLGIKLLDHLVFTDESYYSFLEHGML